jgi:hypothetical protein
MSKKTRSKNRELLETLIEKAMTKPTPPKPTPPNPRGGTPPIAYRFKPGQSGNPSGFSGDARARAFYAQRLTDRMMRSSPPAQLCRDLDIEPSATWGEAILIVLGRTALDGDVSAAREVLATLGFSGTAARNNVLVNVEGVEQSGVTFDFLRHAHGISQANMETVWTFMDSLPKEAPVVDASYFPDESYQDSAAQALQLTEGSNEQQEHKDDDK